MRDQSPIELSALFDGELDHDAAREVLDDVMRSGELRTCWDRYVLIGDLLRKESDAQINIAEAVMARLQDEPIVLSPMRPRTPNRRSPVLAIAASIAGVAVVGWMTFAGGDRLVGEAMQHASKMSPPSTLVAGNVSAGQSRQGDPLVTQSQISEYLIAHHAQAATFRLGDSPEHVRSVALNLRHNK